MIQRLSFPPSIIACLTRVTDYLFADRYVQLFALESSRHGVNEIERTLKGLTKVNSDPGENDRPQDSNIHIQCPENFVWQGVEQCVNSATTISGRGTDPSIMVFCPHFFELSRFSNLKDASHEVIQENYQGEGYEGTDGK